MKLNEKAKHITCGVVVGAMLATATPATALQIVTAPITKSISVVYNNIKIVVDGQQVSTDKHNEPFIYNGTTYLPIRAVGQAVGKQVTWDGNTNTVYLGDNPVVDGEQYLVDVCPPYQGSYVQNTVKMAGKTYVKALGVSSITPTLIDLNGKYSTLEFDLGHQDGYNRERIFSFYVDGTLVDTITLTKDALPTHYSIPLNHGLQLKIESNGYSYEAAITNCTVK